MTTQCATRGVVFIHSVTPALQPHVEWALSGGRGYQVSIEWIDQPADPLYHRGEYAWTGEIGMGVARFAASMKVPTQVAIGSFSSV